MTTSFHEGERALQARVGVAARLAEAGPRVLRDHLVAQHREFFPLLPFVVAGALDAGGQPWASLLAGAPGFAHAAGERTLRIDARPAAADPLHGLLAAGAPVGLLGIELPTRRRNRLNGRLTGVDAAGFEVAVGQSFGNCPKYIQARTVDWAPDAAPAPGALQQGRELDAAALALVGRADTFFLATAHPQARAGADPAHGIDVSHRGGPPGFVAATPQRLDVPDYAGNQYFNTLGNLALEPRCGLLFVDFESGDGLWVAARGTLAWPEAPPAQRLATGRVLSLQVTGWRRVARAFAALRWGPPELSPEALALR